jgi:hypothetical protein
LTAKLAFPAVKSKDYHVIYVDFREDWIKIQYVQILHILPKMGKYIKLSSLPEKNISTVFLRFPV